MGNKLFFSTTKLKSISAKYSNDAEVNCRERKYCQQVKNFSSKFLHKYTEIISAFIWGLSNSQATHENTIDPGLVFFRVTCCLSKWSFAIRKISFAREIGYTINNGNKCVFLNIFLPFISSQVPPERLKVRRSIKELQQILGILTRKFMDKELTQNKVSQFLMTNECILFLLGPKFS